MPVINQEPVPGEPVPGTAPEGPCEWPLNTTCVPGWADYSPAVQAAATSWATYLLWALTGRQYGACEVTIRPCGPRCSGPNGYFTWPVNAGSVTGGNPPWMIPWIDNGLWRNCGCTGGCSCSATCEVAIPGPVAEVVEVTVDGVVVPNTSWRVDMLKGVVVLVRTDGECWPECQDMDADIDEPGSFAITYKQGVSVPLAGMLAAGQLAGEFAKACSGAECALPQQLASLSRNGVEVTVVDPTQFLDQGLTGIANVDLWIRAVNPARRANRTKVYSSDLPGTRYAL